VNHNTSLFREPNYQDYDEILDQDQKSISIDENDENL
jgi:hypothetical protein